MFSVKYFLFLGIELMPIFSNIIKNSDSKFSTNSKEALMKLINWKDSRDKFWKQNQVSDFSIVSTHTMENFTTLSSTAIEIHIPETDDLDFEELLGITGLDVGQSGQISISNITDTVSVNGIEQSGNTLLAPMIIKEDTGTNVMTIEGKDTNSLSAFVSFSEIFIFQLS